jgi:predicted phosphodiesterase
LSSLRVHVISDLHTEYDGSAYTLNAAAAAATCDVIVVAGDAGDAQSAPACVRAIARDAGATPVVYVLGNHEFYKAGPRVDSMARVRAEWQRRAGGGGDGDKRHDAAAADDDDDDDDAAAADAAADAPISNLYVLDNSTVDVHGVRFAGTTLWSDTSSLDGTHAASTLGDYRDINGGSFTPLRAWALYRRNVAWLTATIDASPLPVVVVTHHLPSNECIDARFADSPVNASFASPLDALVAHANVRVWVHGHTHVASDHVLHGTRVVCNPRGCPHEIAADAAGSGSGFQHDKMVDVDVGGVVA